jgi:hypothetical protein
MAQVLEFPVWYNCNKEQSRDISPAEGYPAARGKYLDFYLYTIPAVGPYMKCGEEVGERNLLLDAIINIRVKLTRAFYYFGDQG